jgi:hypothetical protein
MKNSPIVFKDIRNMRRNQTIALALGPSKDVICSTKDLKKARSSQQIDLTSYLEVLPLIFRIRMRRLKTSMLNSKSITLKSRETTKSLSN